MSAAPEERHEVGDLDPAGVLALATTNEREIRERELLRLELAYQWAVLHPATDDTGVETLGGAGTPQVAAFAPEALAVAMGISPGAARTLMADVLDLKHRHPKLRKRVRRLQIAAWQARRVAQQTRHLGRDAAEYVDDRLATHTTLGPKTLDRVVAGTSELWARGDTVDLQAIYDLVCAQAHQRHLDGDSDHLGACKVKALTDLGTADAPHRDKCKLYLWVDSRDLDTDAVGNGEKLGPATMTKIKEWAGHHRVTIQPVLDPRRDDGVDTHDPPPWMRELVILRDGHCVLPGCQVDARSCDLDHTNPLRPERPTRPNPTRQPRLPLQETPPRQDQRTLALHPHARRPLHVARPPRHHAPRDAPRHPSAALTTTDPAAELP